MVSNLTKWRSLCLASLAALLVAASMGADLRGAGAKTGQYDPAAQTVEMFAAIEKGDISVRLIPKDSTESQVLIKNETDQPLNVKLPDAFAGVPILAQAAAGGGGGSHHSGSSGSKGNQGTGGGMGGGGGGFMNVPPEKVGKLKVPTVCLDHGKAEPRPSVPYTIKPIESYSTKPGVRELCQMLGNGQVNQRAAQAAAWHLNNGMSWEQLAAKRVRHLTGQSQPYFSPAEIQSAVQLAASALRAARENEKEKPAPSAATPSSVSGTAK